MSDAPRNPVESLALVGGAIVQSVNEGIDTFNEEVVVPSIAIPFVAVVVGGAGAVIGGTLAAVGVEMNGMDWQTSAEVGMGVFGGLIAGPMAAHAEFEGASIDDKPRDVIARAARNYAIAAIAVGVVAGASPLVTVDGPRPNPTVERSVDGFTAE